MSALVLRNESGGVLKVFALPTSSEEGFSVHFGLHRILGWITNVQRHVVRLLQASLSGCVVLS
ncbi:hypothetical protein EBZ37_09820 [bacterium]|nr:hypothetical protein [bacterium]